MFQKYLEQRILAAMAEVFCISLLWCLLTGEVIAAEISWFSGEGEGIADLRQELAQRFQDRLMVLHNLSDDERDLVKGLGPRQQVGYWQQVTYSRLLALDRAQEKTFITTAVFPEWPTGLLSARLNVFAVRLEEFRRSVREDHVLVETVLDVIYLHEIREQLSVEDYLIMAFLVPEDLNLFTVPRVLNALMHDNPPPNQVDGSDEDHEDGQIIVQLPISVVNKIRESVQIINMIESSKHDDAVRLYVDLLTDHSKDEWPLPEIGYYLGSAIFRNELYGEGRAVEIYRNALIGYGAYIDLPKIAMALEVMRICKELTNAERSLLNIDSNLILEEKTAELNSTEYIYPYRSILAYVNQKEKDWREPRFNKDDLQKRARLVNAIISQRIIPKIINKNTTVSEGELKTDSNGLHKLNHEACLQTKGLQSRNLDVSDVSVADGNRGGVELRTLLVIACGTLATLAIIALAIKSRIKSNRFNEIF